jgi:prevent-host-death family protein
LPISVFRKDANRILGSIKKTGGYCLLSRSLPKAVILDIAKYEELKGLLEDLVDAMALEKAKGEKTVSWKRYLKTRYGDKD